MGHMDWLFLKLLDEDNYTAFRQGWTNIPNARAKDLLSQDALYRIRREYPQFQLFDQNNQDAAVRVDPDTGIEILVLEANEESVEPTHNKITQYQFSMEGELLNQTTGKGMGWLSRNLSYFTLGLFALARWTVPSVRQNTSMRRQLERRYSEIIAWNQAEAEEVPMGLTTISIERTNRDHFTMLDSGPLLGLIPRDIEIGAQLLGADVVINYQAPAPAKRMGFTLVKGETYPSGIAAMLKTV